MYGNLALSVFVRKIQQTFEISLGFLYNMGEVRKNWPETTLF